MNSREEIRWKNDPIKILRLNSACCDKEIIQLPQKSIAENGIYPLRVGSVCARVCFTATCACKGNKEHNAELDFFIFYFLFLLHGTRKEI